MTGSFIESPKQSPGRLCGPRNPRWLSSDSNEGLAPGIMKSYLAAVRHEQTSMGLGDTHIAQMPQLEYGLKGAKRWLVLGVRKRLPITQSILQKLREVWAKLAEQQDAMGGIMPLFLCLYILER